MHTAGRMHMAGRRAGLGLGFVRVSSAELNVFLISRHVAICTSGRVMITNDTRPAMCKVSVCNFSSMMLSSLIDCHLVTTNVDSYGSCH